MPEGCDALDIKDPLNMSNNNCMSYLEKMIPTWNEKMQAALGSGDRPTMKYY